MQSKEIEIFSTMPIKKAVISLAIPTVISQLITVVYNMADTFFIGQLNDPNQVAAATVIMPIFMFLTAFANLFGLGGSSLISRCLGVGEHEKAKSCASFCIWSGIVVSFLYGILIVVFSSFILPILGANQYTWDYCYEYMLITIGIGAVPTVMNAELAHLIRAEGYSKKASIGVALGGILNIVLDPIFIFVFHMEIKGAAIATMISNLCAMIYFFIFIYKIKDKSVITPRLKKFTFGNNIPSEVIAVGLPSFIMTFMSSISNTTLNYLVASYSNEAIAGMGIAKKIDLIAFAIAQGMTQGTLPLIGYNYASDNNKRMKETIKTVLLYSLVVACVGTFLIYIGAVSITKCFIQDNATIYYGQKFLKIICLACPTTALNFMIITIFQATGKKTQPLILSLLRKGGIDIPFMILINNILGVDGIAWATPIADWIAFIISGVMISFYLKSLFKLKKYSKDEIE